MLQLNISLIINNKTEPSNLRIIMVFQNDKQEHTKSTRLTAIDLKIVLLQYSNKLDH